MPHIHVIGGKPLQGEVRASGSKNAALPLLAATLLSDRPVTLRNVPSLQDVDVMCAVLRSIGARAERTGHPPDGSVTVDASALSGCEPPYELVNRMRASFLVLGPLLARYGEASVPLPGGCEIGVRPVDEHLKALEALGAELTQDSGRIVAHARGGRLRGAEIHLNIASVGATENAVMAACLADGTSTIHNAAAEPEVTDLCDFLVACGAEIEGAGSKSITVHGRTALSAELEYDVIPDRIEAGTYLLAIAGTGGRGRVIGARQPHLEACLGKLREAGAEVEPDGDGVTIAAPQRLRAVNIRTDVHPGFPTDLQPQFATVLACAEGVSTIHETVFERRMGHAAELHRMGAQAVLSGDTLIVTGVDGLAGVPVEATDLRGAAALVVAGLMAQGETHIAGLQHLLRGYELLPEKVAALGGQVDYVYDESDPPARSAAAVAAAS
jgi:UDP-N-acetylglucosamine 1-carboxyvinyltransferase